MGSDEATERLRATEEEARRGSRVDACAELSPALLVAMRLADRAIQIQYHQKAERRFAIGICEASSKVFHGTISPPKNGH